MSSNVKRIAKSRSWKIYFIVLATALIFLNGLTLLSALPETTGTQPYCQAGGCITVARDFSAYYEGAHRFLYNPSQVYILGNVSGDTPILPNPQNYRYSPFFLPIFIVPLTLLFSYQNALRFFDLLQFLLLPLIAYLLYEIFLLFSPKRVMDKRTAAFLSVALLFVLLQPLVFPLSNFTLWSWSYWRLWEQGQARVLQTLFLVLSFYLLLKKSKFSGLAFVLSSFDPRMSILALPLMVYLGLKLKNLRQLTLSTFLSFAVIYVPTFLYANLWQQFYDSIFLNTISIYSYEWIPLLTVIFLTFGVVALDLANKRQTRISANSTTAKRRFSY
ncbi:MAG: hypothetical protein OK439_06725 [Thaumarchaeota archaeon]|nr:hypothetical protein [Nitrososphaerota archaeon]